jgi:hypothetical protein
MISECMGQEEEESYRIWMGKFVFLENSYSFPLGSTGFEIIMGASIFETNFTLYKKNSNWPEPNGTIVDPFL